MIKLLSIILISCLGIVVYSNTFHNTFQFDDVYSIVTNYAIRNISNLQTIGYCLPRRFILYLSLAINYHYNQLDVFGYHLFNLVVHLISTILVWWLVLLTAGGAENKIKQHANLIALFAGLIFVAHPVQTQAVTYIVQRAASLTTLFYLASLCFYVKSRLLSQQAVLGKPASTPVIAEGFYICSLIAAILAILTKEMAITLPLMILLYEYSFLKGTQKFNWKYSLPFILIFLIISFTILISELGSARWQHIVGEAGISPVHYLLTQLRVMLTYLRLAFLPLFQNVDYDYPVSKSLFELPALFGLLFLIGILLLAKRLFLKYRLVSFSIFWFFLTLLPESSVFPIQDVINEHRLYLPMAGFSLFLVSSLFYIFGKNNLKGLIIALLVLVSAYSILAYQRNQIWRDELTLWDDAVHKSPHKARPYNNRGVALFRLGKLDLALADFNEAIKIMPAYAQVYNNLGNFYSKQGNFNQALSNYNKAIELNPYFKEAYNGRGNTFRRQGSFSKALPDLNKTIELDPNYASGYYNRGLDYDEQGKLNYALADYNKAIELNPEDADPYVDRGRIYEKVGNYLLALADYNKAIAINPDYADAYHYRAFVFYYFKKYDRAWADARKAGELRYPVNPKLISALKQALGAAQ